eukprot:4465081-Ditylum_brightwellii.AAC.1
MKKQEGSFNLKPPMLNINALQSNTYCHVEALPGLTKRDTRVGANTTARKMVRWQITPKPGSVPIAH